MNTGDVIIHYAQPKVKYFTLCQGSGLSDSFLDTLSRSCPKLKLLILSRISESSVSEDGLVRFLENIDSLDYLNIRTGLNDSWSYKAFDVITGYRTLELLFIPDIQDDWVHSLRHASLISTAFPNLKHFYTVISDQGLEFLARYVPNLETLAISLQNLPPSHHILASASSFTKLTSLTVHFGPQSSLSGQDLLLLTQKCPELAELFIGEDEGYRPTGSGITDSIIDEVAQKMTKISQLSLIFDRPDLLTWQSILSLARHCKNLEMLKLSCNFTWQEAINSAWENAFPTLWALEIVLDENNRDANDNEETINTFAARFGILAPKLTSFTIVGGNEADQSFEAAVTEICMDRMWKTALTVAGYVGATEPK